MSSQNPKQRSKVTVVRRYESLAFDVLSSLPGSTDEFYAHISGLEPVIRGVPRGVVRSICKDLRFLGLAECKHGLMDDAGEVAGSGYARTTHGDNRVAKGHLT